MNKNDKFVITINREVGSGGRLQPGTLPSGWRLGRWHDGTRHHASRLPFLSCPWHGLWLPTANEL